MTTTTTTTTTSMQTVILKVGLHCEGCERRVKKAIWHLKGITSVDVDDTRERITVTGFVDPARILKAVKKTGKPVELWKYQNGNKNLYGSQPLPAPAPAKLSNASKGNKVQNNNAGKNSNSGDKYPGFQHGNTKLNDHKHPQSDYFSDADSEFDSFETDFYGSDNLYTEFKPPKNQKSNEFYGDFKSPKNQKKSNEFYGDFKSPKNQKNNNEFYGDFKSPKNQKNNEDFKSPKNHQKNEFYGAPKNQKNDVYSDFKPPSNQQKGGDFYDEHKPQKNHHHQKGEEFYDEIKPQKNHHQNHHQKPPGGYNNDFKPQKNQNSDYYGNFKSPKEHQKPVKNRPENEFSHFSYEDENEFNRKPKSNVNQSSYDEEKISNPHQKNKASGYNNAGNNHSSYDDFKNSNSSSYGNHQHHQHQQKHDYSSFDTEEGSFNHKKAPKSQMPAKYVSFEDEYERSYRPQAEARPPQVSRGPEQKFYTTYGHEQSYYPSYTYHESHRIPAASGFTNMFSEENPNACSIM